MKDKWRIRYQKIDRLLDGKRVNILTGFNANIDLLYDLEDLGLDLSGADAELKNPVENVTDLKYSLKYCLDKGKNEEVDGENFYRKLDGNPERKIGGQAGIIANFLSGFENYVMFHTPLLSEDLANMISDEVVSPVIDGKLLLKRVKECVNTDRTKKNTIIEFEGENTGRFIVSDSMRGFGPYFRSGVEENFEVLEEELDRMILSGYHDIAGNMDTKLQKSRKQLHALETEKHLEYVAMKEQDSRKIFDKILPEFESVGMDKTEALQLADFMEIDAEEDLDISQAVKLGRKLIEEKNLERVHIHTYRYHVCVASPEYQVSKERMRDAMLFGEACAVQMAEQGDIPDLEDMEKFELDRTHVHRLDPLEKLGEKLGKENLTEKGVYRDEEVKIAAIPTLIHEEPERMVGMGDIISSGAYTAELK